MPEPPQTREDLLRALLANHDEPCPGCGYNLRGLTGEACPECGEALRLQVGMVEQRMKLYLFGLVGLACGLGFDMMMLPFVAYTNLWGWGGWGTHEITALVVGMLCCGGAMSAWLRARAWVRHRTIAVRVPLVTGCWLLSAAATLWFFALIS